MSEKADQNIDEKIMLCAAQWEAPFDSDISSQKAAVLQRIDQDEMDQEDPKKESRVRPFTKVAAALVVLLGCAVALYFISDKTVKNNSEKSVLCALPDGSEIMLTPHSTVQYNLLVWPLRRSVHFSGEGFFSVVRGNPFTVITENSRIEVLGTKFTVWTDDNDLLVHCSSGRVRVRHNAEETELLAGEFTRMEKNKLTKKMVYNTQDFIAPRVSNKLTFKEVPVGIVLSELEKVFQTEFINELPENLIYSGILDIRDKNQCLEVFCKPFGAKVDSANGLVSIHL